jgi:hypothetical protein
MTVTDDLLVNNERYAAGFKKGDLAMPPANQAGSFTTSRPGCFAR